MNTNFEPDYKRLRQFEYDHDKSDLDFYKDYSLANINRDSYCQGKKSLSKRLFSGLVKTTALLTIGTSATYTYFNFNPEKWETIKEKIIETYNDIDKYLKFDN